MRIKITFFYKRIAKVVRYFIYLRLACIPAYKMLASIQNPE